jgi:hypothetical protein
LEVAISIFVWQLISNDQRLGQIITAELSFRNLVGILSSIFKYRNNNQELIEELNKLLDQAIQAEEQRNLIIHSNWAVGSSQDTISRYKTTAKKSKGYSFQFEQISGEDLDKISQKICDVAVEIQLFMINIMSPK